MKIGISGICETVYIVHRRREFRAQRALVDRARARENIRLLTPYEPVLISPDDLGRVRDMTVRNMETGETVTLPTPGVFTAIGMVPLTEPFAGLVTLDKQGCIVAGEDCETGVPGVYAAGDCRTKPLRQLVTAAADGAVAATAAARYVDGLRG